MQVEKNIILKKFEATDVIINVVDGVPMFELYSVGMALGYTKTAKGKHYPRNERIDTIVKNAGISVVVHSGQQLINENQLNDFMLEARTAKCKLFRKWIVEEVLPTINKTGGYIGTDIQFGGAYQGEFYLGDYVNVYLFNGMGAIFGLYPAE